MFPSCIVVDFDGTLAYFRGGYDDLFNIFCRRGVGSAVVRECYERTKREGGFSITALAACVAVHAGCYVDLREVESEFCGWLRRSLIPYQDGLEALDRWRQQGLPVVILTTGNIEYQTQKVQAVRLSYDQLIVVSHAQEKPAVVRRLLADFYGSPVLLIEDRPSVLDAMRDDGLSEDQVATVRLLRQESPYIREHSVYRHRSCNTLDEISLEIES